MAMIVYLDEAFRCHATCGERMRTVDTPFFDGKCAAFIEGYRFVPEGESRTDEHGTVFLGEMIAPWKSYAQLDAAQREYEHQQYEEARAAYAALEDGLGSI